MKKTALIVVGAIVLVVIIAIVAVSGTYNSFVSKQTAVEEKMSSIDTQLQRRLDLIPNLVETVKGYAAHETEVYTAIADARAALQGASTVSEKAEANGELDSALNRLLVIVENYPELKANENFTALQDELAGTENRIARARDEYNATAREYNTAIRKFPANIFARMFGFSGVDYFEAASGAENAPTVSFS